ncbi:polycomb group protein EMBRYONIC FLOWER 2-like isoform X1 [Salvia splendens]|uniref:polycomb group protein EMBRYONIC FLOWER 2-like isoform X1 n=1 Tax=Salvia splendens TaxID=180675 RepID=UPI001C26FB88|nr:polycomb group protein EMBRYONIC FLOWER 2-like isoform X1 [Salvia splendens]XP_042048449.1 polycomb group protein EMBRYONIC FLOWER 2-like isoform X1 [Salvia splendens]
MPGIPLVARETANCVCNCSYSQGADHMCRQDPRAHLSPEEQIAAEESLSIYCKPVELYNILQRRAARNPSFLQRCLRYKMQAKHKKRIQMTISLPSTANDESQIQSLLPLCIMLARPVYSPAVVEDSAVYRFRRECILTKCTEDDAMNQDEANFILPEINKLSAEVKSGSLTILFVSCAELFKEQTDAPSFPANVGGHCFLGKIPMELLHLSSGGRAEMLSSVDLHSCFLKTGCFGEDRCFSFHSPHAGAMALSQQLQVRVAAEEIGLKQRSPYDSFSYYDVPSSTLPQIIRLRTGNVVFNYRYYNNKLQRTEVTEDFTCPFCLVKCASFKGLRFHLPACHDLFNFEFWVGKLNVTEEFQAVNISVKTDTWRSENVAAGVDPKQQTFFLCSKAPRRRKMKSPMQNPKFVHPLVLDSEMPGSIIELREKTVEESADRDASSPRASSATAHSYADPECVQSLPGNIAHPALLQFAKTRKLSVERSDPRNRALLQKRQFFHSHRAQPMAMEQVLSDRDSEDEVDDDVADLEDRRMLDDFVDVTKDEKRLMHLWNSFVRKQRVLADGHIPWACEAFSKLHKQDLVQIPALLWCWRLFMIKLWNHGLLDARTMNSCNIILEQPLEADVDQGPDT